MGSYSEHMEAMQEEGQKLFVRKVLDDTFNLTHEDYQDAAASIDEIIHVATAMLEMPKDELATKLVNLRNFAAHNQVEITLPAAIEEAARLAAYKIIREQRRPDNQVREVRERDTAGLLRMLGEGRENG